MKAVMWYHGKDMTIREDMDLNCAEVKIMIGPAGSGKTEKCYEELVDAAAKRPGQHFYLIVPDQAGSSTEQRLLAVNRERTRKPGFFNLDVFGFSRLAHTILADAGIDTREVLGEYGKTVLLRSVMARVKQELQLYGGSIDRRGFVDEIKSLISEFLLFDISPDNHFRVPDEGKNCQKQDKQQ